MGFGNKYENIEIWVYIHLKLVSGMYKSPNTKDCGFVRLAGCACREIFRGGQFGVVGFIRFLRTDVLMYIQSKGWICVYCETK